MKDLTEKTITSESIFEGRVIRLQVDEVTLPNGSISQRELIKHPGAVAIIAITDQNRLVLVRQYRKALEKVTIEIPAGKLETGENPRNCAQRELEEETGYRARSMDEMVSFYTSPGFANELVHLFQAKGVERTGKTNLDQDEFVELLELSFDEATAYIESGQICDAKTVYAIQWWKSQRS